jgi:hypothetical protein
MSPSRLTVLEEAYRDLERHVRANGGRLKPLTAQELAQPVPVPPDLNAAVRLASAKRRVEEEKKRQRR